MGTAVAHHFEPLGRAYVARDVYVSTHSRCVILLAAR